MSYASYDVDTWEFDELKVTLEHIRVLAPSDAVALAYGEDFTGLKVWPGSLLLVKCLMQERARLQGKSVLEVGAGIGLSGSLIAQLCGSPCVISDGTEETIGILKRNIERNGLTDKVNIEQWLWQTDNAKFKEKYPDGFDFIVGGDLIYSEEAIVPLLETVKEFLKPGGEFLMVHLDRGTRRLGDLMFSKASSEYGLTCTRDELQKIDEDDPDSWRFVFRKP